MAKKVRVMIEKTVEDDDTFAGSLLWLMQEHFSDEEFNPQFEMLSAVTRVTVTVVTDGHPVDTIDLRNEID